MYVHTYIHKVHRVHNYSMHMYEYVCTYIIIYVCMYTCMVAYTHIDAINSMGPIVKVSI